MTLCRSKWHQLQLACAIFNQIRHQSLRLYSVPVNNPNKGNLFFLEGGHNGPRGAASSQNHCGLGSLLPIWRSSLQMPHEPVNVGICAMNLAIRSERDCVDRAASHSVSVTKITDGECTSLMGQSYIKSTHPNP